MAAAAAPKKKKRSDTLTIAPDPRTDEEMWAADHARTLSYKMEKCMGQIECDSAAHPYHTVSCGKPPKWASGRFASPPYYGNFSIDISGAYCDGCKDAVEMRCASTNEVCPFMIPINRVFGNFLSMYLK
jgi:hypothetical protein